MKKLNGRMTRLEKNVKGSDEDIETKLGTIVGAVAELRTELSEVSKSAAEKWSTVQCEVLSEIKD